MYLQLHDDWDTSYTGGKLEPLKTSENPLAPGAPVAKFNIGYVPLMGQGCAVSLPQDLLRNAKGFKDSLKQLEKTYKDIKGGKKKIKVEDGTMGVDPATTAMVIQAGKWVVKNFDKIIALGGALRNLYLSLSVSAINNKTMTRYNANAFGIQNVCSMNARQILAAIDSVDAEINAVLNQISTTSKLNAIKRATLSGDLASLTQFRLAFQKQLDSIGGAGVTSAGGLGIAAAALAALSFLR